MANHAIAGINGSYAYANHVVRATRWSISTSQDVHDATGFGASANWRITLPGLKSGRLQVSGYLLEGAANSAPGADYSMTGDSNATGTAVAFTLTAGTSTYTGNAWPSSFTVGHDVNGVATAMLEGVVTGAVTETIATS